MPDEPTGAAPAEGTPTPSPAPETTAPEPWAPVMDRVSELANTIDGRFQALEQRIPQPEPEPEPDPWAVLLGEPEQQVDAYGNPVQAQPPLDPAAIQQVVEQRIQQALQQANAPLVQQLQALQQERGREQLYAEIPQLKDPEVAQQTIRGMQQYLAEAGAPPEVAQWLVNSPQAIKNYFKAAEAEKLAAGQAPASEQPPSLEAAGGAVPGGNGEQPNIVHQAYASRGQGLPRGF